jgi:DNA ligase (NAD+)
MVECKNEGCPRKMAHRFRKMFKTFGIKYTGDKFIQNLEDEGVTIEDFLKMCKGNDKKVLNKYSGNSNGEKVYEQMRNIGPITAAQFLAIFDAPMLDEKRFLLFGNKTLDELMFLSCKSKEEVMKFKGIGEEIADLFLDFFNKNSKEIIALRQYFTFESVYATIEENNGGGKKMSMPTICFTGACPGFTRNELTEKCRGKYDVKDSVTKDLNYLACADPNSGSSKLQKAAKNGTKIISYTELLQSL